MACNDIVLTGSFNGWKSKASECILCEAVEGYDGWYVVAFDPEDEPDESKGIQAKPVMLDANGQFNWEYQIGAATAIRGGVQVVQGAYAGEIDLTNYGTDAPNVYTVDAWKQNPCTAVYHNYTIAVINDGCDLMAVPFVIGAMTNWEWQEMQLNDEIEDYDYYYYNFKGAEGTPFQLGSGLRSSEPPFDIADMPGWKDDAYMQKLVDSVWVRMPGEDGDNLLTHEEPVILFDLRVDSLRWARCDGIVAENVTVKLIAPAGAPDSIEIIGSYDAWTGSAMELNDGVWEATVSAKPNAVFKFRQAGNWDNQIEYYDEDEDNWFTFGDDGGKALVFGELWTGEEGARVITLDFSDAETYQWQQSGEPEEPEYTIVAVKLPADAPAAVEIIGTFDGWTGTAMELLETGYYFVELEAKPSDTFKFREAGTWDNELVDAITGEAMSALKFKDKWADDSWKGVECKWVELELDAEYVWKANYVEGIENVVLTEKAQKVVVDGVIYIIRNNKMFNLQGAQVR
jgi:hypothetical protein